MGASGFFAQGWIKNRSIGLRGYLRQNRPRRALFLLSNFLGFPDALKEILKGEAPILLNREVQKNCSRGIFYGKRGGGHIN
jgi:hypothetical protein